MATIIIIVVILLLVGITILGLSLMRAGRDTREDDRPPGPFD